MWGRSVTTRDSGYTSKVTFTCEIGAQSELQAAINQPLA